MNEHIFDPNSVEWMQSKFIHYDFLRKQDPCSWNSDLGFWALSRHGDVVGGLSDYESYSANYGTTLEMRTVYPEKNKFLSFIIQDPPEHEVLKKKFQSYLSNFFDLNLINLLNYEIEEVLKKIPINQPISFNSYFSDIPIIVLSKILNIDKSCVHEIIESSKYLFNNSSVDEQKYFFKKITKILKRYYKTNFDLDLLDYYCSISIAGYETTIASMRNLFIDLETYSDQFEKINLNNAYKFIEESLRISHASSYLVRTSTRKISLHKKIIKEGDSVIFLTGSANSDTLEFGKGADEFNIYNSLNIKNLVFGHGPHRCLGSHVARMQLNLIISFLLKENLNVKILEKKIKKENDLSGTLFEDLELIIFKKNKD